MALKQHRTNSKGEKRASESWDLAVQGECEDRWGWAVHKAIRTMEKKHQRQGYKYIQAWDSRDTDLMESFIHSTNIYEVSAMCQAQCRGYRGELAGLHGA